MSLAARFTEIAYPTLDLMLVAIIVRLVLSTVLEISAIACCSPACPCWS